MGRDELRRREWTRKHYALKYANGICQKCGNKRKTGSIMCEEHLEKRRQYAANVRAQRTSIGQCCKCEKPLASGSVFCEEHLEVNRKANLIRSEKRREIKLLNRSIKSSFSSDKPKRQSIEDMRAEVIAMRKAEGKCIADNCRWNAMPGSATCLLHGSLPGGE